MNWKDIFLLALVVGFMTYSVLTPTPDTKLDTNPSPAEIKLFLANNGVDRHEYNESYYCVHFAYDLMSDLNDAGYYACTAYVEYANNTYAHSVVAINTTDGLKYIEPQSDAFINLGINSTYGGDTITDLVSCYD